MVEIRVISVMESMEEAAPLMREHWTALERRREVLGLNPNLAAYRTLEESGSLIALGAFDSRGMIGYCVSIITRHLHDADLIYVANDVLYVANTYRGSMAGGRLMQETERIGRERGAKLVCWTAKPQTALYEILKKHDGYAVHEVMFSKTL